MPGTVTGDLRIALRSSRPHFEAWHLRHSICSALHSTEDDLNNWKSFTVRHVSEFK